MAININANSSTQLIVPVSEQAVKHDIVDLVNGNAYRQIRAGENLVAGDVVEGITPSASPSRVKEGNWRMLGVAIGIISSGQWGFVQSFGFGQAKVETGTPANAFLVPSQNAGLLRAIDPAEPELTTFFLGLLDQRDQSGSVTPNYIRLIVSLTAESGGMADVFIF
jgi:hypothetical protein